MLEKPPPLVSVLMTAYNREKYIAEAIESILASTYTNYELIIVDDGSSDKTVSIAKAYEQKDPRIKVFQNEVNLGDYPNRNKAASLASGKYIKYVDSDDLIYPYGLEIFVQAMEEHPEAVLGITSRNPVPFCPFPILLSPKEVIRKHFFEYGVLDYGHTGVIIHRNVFNVIGGFSGKRFIGDQECWFKIALQHPVLELPPSLTYWRRHEGQEFKLGVGGIEGGYFSLELNMIREVVNNKDCPLTEAEKRQILKKQNKNYARSLTKHALKTGQIVKVIRKFYELKISIFDLL